MLRLDCALSNDRCYVCHFIVECASNILSDIYIYIMCFSVMLQTDFTMHGAVSNIYIYIYYIVCVCASVCVCESAEVYSVFVMVLLC